MADMSSWVKAVGISVLLIGIMSVIVGKFRGIDDVGSINASDGVQTANESMADGITLLGDMIDYIEIGVLILIGAFFFSKLTKKGGMGQ
jgi:O-antigen/teichoic acid export membrane protein